MKRKDSVLFTANPDWIRQRGTKYGQDYGRIVIGGDAVHGKASTFDTLVNQHQLASLFPPILVSAVFHGQPDRLHLPFAGGQPVPCGNQIEMTRPQAVWTMVAVVHTREKMRARDEDVTVDALEISKGGGVMSHSSSRRRI